MMTLLFIVYISMPSYLGQNFLTDTSIQTHIIDTAHQLYIDNGCNTIIEIGPGK
jgi:16S rRNA A1518/A1519 N6-dimethyltransferase RsmA/KsgA/DIM1 with predicted DNA glycosylase/AP lyase activity